MAAYKYMTILLPILAGVLANNQVIFNSPTFNITANSGDGKIYCGDSLLCPNGSVACDYSEKNSVYNQSVVIVLQKCLDSSGNIMAMKNSSFIDTNGEMHDVNIYTGEYSNDVNYPNKDEIKKDIKKMQDEIHHEIQNILNGIKKKFGEIQNRLDCV